MPFDFALCQDSPALINAPPAQVVGAVVQLVAVGPGARGKNCEVSATGFFVNEEGYLLTNAHMVDDARRCLTMSPGAKILAKFAPSKSRVAPAVSCDVVAVDEVHDVAVLKTERPLVEAAGAGQCAFASLNQQEVQDGTPVAVTGHPFFAWQAVTQTGQVVRRGTLRLGDDGAEQSQVMVLNIPTKVGNSGSPVYLETGGVVGIIERTDPLRASNTVAVPIRYAIELLDRWHVQWHAARGE